jgi:hypothetical protein
MKRIFTTLLISLAASWLVACATVGGAAVGAGIGHIAGDAKTGALIGGGAGLLFDVL